MGALDLKFLNDEEHTNSLEHLKELDRYVYEI
jgi:hypothetical protein